MAEKKHIYVLEDDENIRGVIEVILDSEKYEISFFEDVRSLNAEMINTQPDLAILDAMLPDGNGADVCEDIKADMHTASIPVILMSANSTAIAMRNSVRADDFLSKPFDIDDFVERVEALIG